MYGERSDLMCFSHLRWSFVVQRPNHLMARFARSRRVFFVEEPLFGEASDPPRLEVTSPEPGLFVCVPRLPACPAERAVELQKDLLDGLVAERSVALSILWLFTPLALPLTTRLLATVTVYDCMDAPRRFEARALEQKLLSRADIVFAGGHSLWEALRPRHPRVYVFPSSADVAHFEAARAPLEEPADQALLLRPRVGFFGIIDERLDLALLGSLARAHPKWELVMLGPVMGISEASLPRAPNLHFLGQKAYDEIPAYVAGWDAAMLPFAVNHTTRFISPPAVLECLAAGKPVVATPIREIVHPIGDLGLVQVASRAAFARALALVLQGGRLVRNDGAARRILKSSSWDTTWAGMARLVDGLVSSDEPDSRRATVETCSVA